MIAKLKREPAVVRALIVALLDVLVVGGVIDTRQSGAVDALLLAVLNVAVGFQVRQRVKPLSPPPRPDLAELQQ